jgi:DNA mismatch repair protein MutS
VALEKKWVKPEISDDKRLSIQGGRHPVVESMLPAGKFVENDCLLDSEKNQLVVLTGPNMAGKSTYIRQTAHIVLLAQMGSFVPVKSARVGLVDRIFTRIGASDDLARGESTFMVEMLETAHILQETTDRSLLILDEVGRGTSTFDGVSIAWAVCEFLAQGKAKPRTLFATHYHELTQLEGHFSSIKNYKMTVKETPDGIGFLRKVARGASERSYGIHVAELAGIPGEVTCRAKEILAILESENTEATQIIESKKPKSSRRVAETGPTLFDVAAARPSELEEDLKKLDVDRLTPIEALQKIAAWKKKISGGEKSHG